MHHCKNIRVTDKKFSNSFFFSLFFLAIGDEELVFLYPSQLLYNCVCVCTHKYIKRKKRKALELNWISFWAVSREIKMKIKNLTENNAKIQCLSVRQSLSLFFFSQLFFCDLPSEKQRRWIYPIHTLTPPPFLFQERIDSVNWKIILKYRDNRKYNSFAIWFKYFGEKKLFTQLNTLHSHQLNENFNWICVYERVIFFFSICFHVNVVVVSYNLILLHLLL